jgi:DNA-binding LacI/PurR family transcriptional regulator
VRGVEAAATAANYNLLIASQPREMTNRSHIDMFTQRWVDGLVMAQINVSAQEASQIVRRGLPIAMVQQALGEDIPTVVADNYGGACALVEHLLLVHRYRRLAYIAGNDDTPDNAERLRGLRDVLARHRLGELPAERIVYGNYWPGSGYRPMLQLLELAERPDAVFAANDQMANDALRALREHGLSVPDTIAVVGFDDVPLADYATPPLTTVHQPIYELGFEAAKAVLDAIEGKPAPTRKVLETTLAIRRSCGCNP